MSGVSSPCAAMRGGACDARAFVWARLLVCPPPGGAINRRLASVAARQRCSDACAAFVHAVLRVVSLRGRVGSRAHRGTRVVVGCRRAVPARRRLVSAQHLRNHVCSSRQLYCSCTSHSQPPARRASAHGFSRAADCCTHHSISTDTQHTLLEARTISVDLREDPLR